MVTKLLRLSDDVLVEVEANPEEFQQILGGEVAEKVAHGAISKIEPVIKQVVSACQFVREGMEISELELQFGLSFEGEGNVYLCKVTSSANFSVKLVFKPQEAKK